MPIGYANFGTIEQANNQTVNQLAGLGQQIGNAIETHAATQSAQAMLPMLQQQYQNGMSKIASGDPNGLGDVYSASVVASQNPLLAPMANHAVNMAQSANINAQHMLRTQAMIQGRNLGLAAKYPGFMNLQTGEINPNYTPQAKQTTIPQQMAAQKTGVELQNTYKAQMDQAIKDNDPNAYTSAVQALNSLNANAANTGISPTGVPLTFEARKKAMELGTQLDSELAKPTGAIHPSWLGGQNQKTIDNLSNQIQELHSDKKNLITIPQSSQLPSVKGSGSMGSGKWNNPNVPDSAVKYLLQNPSVADQFDAKYGKGMAGQILKSQSSNDTGMGANIAQTSPESQDESEAVGGGSEEETPPDEQTMVA